MAGVTSWQVSSMGLLMLYIYAVMSVFRSLFDADAGGLDSKEWTGRVAMTCMRNCTECYTVHTRNEALTTFNVCSYVVCAS